MRKMKFKIGDKLYYVDKFVFTIEKVKIAFLHDEFYCDETYAMMEEDYLFEDLEKAKNFCFNLLRDFYNKKVYEINTYTEV